MKKINKHKRYLLFAFSEYYPNGGLGDIYDTYDTMEDAVIGIEDACGAYRCIYDRYKGIVIYYKEY